MGRFKLRKAKSRSGVPASWFAADECATPEPPKEPPVPKPSNAVQAAMAIELIFGSLPWVESVAIVDGAGEPHSAAKVEVADTPFLLSIVWHSFAYSNVGRGQWRPGDIPTVEAWLIRVDGEGPDPWGDVMPYATVEEIIAATLETLNTEGVL